MSSNIILQCLTSSEKFSLINTITHPECGYYDRLEIVWSVIKPILVIIDSILHIAKSQYFSHILVLSFSIPAIVFGFSRTRLAESLIPYICLSDVISTFFYLHTPAQYCHQMIVAMCFQHHGVAIAFPCRLQSDSKSY